MSRRRSGGMLAGSPVLVGAVTVIVAMVAVFLSYNANEGLPFVPTYKLNANVNNADGLVLGNEVRMGGARIGVVTGIEAESGENGEVAANLTLELDERIVPLPDDSTMMIRPRSALGLKYVEITRGDASSGFPENATIPLAATEGENEEIDDFFNMFDAPTRVGSRSNLETYGAAFAGRGGSLNRAFAQLVPVVEKLEPVMRNINAPRTALGRLFPALEQAASEVAPIADTHAQMWGALDVTFGAWASVSDSLQETISEGPPALETATRELPRQRPFLASSEELFRRFRPAFASLGEAAPGMSAAYEAGIPALERSPGFNRRLTKTLATLEEFGDDPRVPSGLARITSTVEMLRPTLSFVTPAQTLCNYGTLFFRNLSSITSESDAVGSFLAVDPMALPVSNPPILDPATSDSGTPYYFPELPESVNSEGGPASAPANGPVLPDGATQRERSLFQDSFLHSNPYPNTAAPGQPQECEAGTEGYTPGVNGVDQQAIGNPATDAGLITEETVRVLPKGPQR